MEFTEFSGIIEVISQTSIAKERKYIMYSGKRKMFTSLNHIRFLKLMIQPLERFQGQKKKFFFFF